ncbi:MAG: hypothetical protein HC841_00340 [Verrucomicrobiae bacterium]|nr:hypothetical protein [Verrucomicrobiae bacterium]
MSEREERDAAREKIRDILQHCKENRSRLGRTFREYIEGWLDETERKSVDAEQVLAMTAEGKSAREICDALGCHHNSVYRIRRANKITGRVKARTDSQ